MIVTPETVEQLAPAAPVALVPDRRNGGVPSATEVMVHRLGVELRAIELRTERVRRQLEAEDPHSSLARGAVELAESLAADLMSDGRREIRLSIEAAEEAASARLAGAVREAHSVLAVARNEVLSALDDRAIVVDDALRLAAGGSAARALMPPVSVPVVPLSALPVPPEPTPAAAALPAPPVKAVVPESSLALEVPLAPEPVAEVVGRVIEPEFLRANSNGLVPAEESTFFDAPGLTASGENSTDGPDGSGGVEVVGAIEGDRAFWTEEETTRSRGWLRPVEVILPLIAALVLIVVLLLVFG